MPTEYRVTQRDVVRFLADLHDLRNSTGTLRGRLTKVDAHRVIYEVFSYAELIARLEYVDGKLTVKWITDKKWSVTTSKHTGFVRRAFQELVITTP
jgi:hypothetical protein